MSNKVDTRVVRMEFDNAQFEKKVKQTTKSLDQLNQSMNFQDAGKGLEKVKVSISAIEAAAVTAIVRITNKIIDLGVQMVKSLSVDNISAGWGKFGEKTTSVATMMAQKIRIAGEEISDLGERTEVVAKQLELLTWFSDETSYSFTDMVNNVGKFTAAGQDLDKSVKAMEGIATWAALSGQNATTASRAMYQLAQAMGKGKIQKIDWMSIQNANMDTEEFRETILKTAVAMGELTQEGDKFITKTGKKFTQSQFAEFLSEGWFTSDVLVEGLNKYSAAIDQIYKLAEENGMTASEVIEEFGDQLDEFGVKAFKAAQEARTFTDVLNSVKDAVSSKWMTTFENIFGNQEEAVKLWTDLANELYDVFAESGNFRNNVLDIWKSIGGRNDIFKKGGSDQGAFWNIYDAIRAVLDTIKDAWNTIFPLSTMEKTNDQAEEIGRNLKIITSNIRSATQAFVNNKEILNTISRVSKLIFSVIKSTINVLRLVRFVLDPIIELGKQLVNRIFDNVLTFLEKFNSSGLDLERIAIGLRNKLADLISVIKVDKILEILFVILDKIIKLISKVPDILRKISPAIKVIGNALVEIIKFILKIPSVLNLISKKITGKGIIENIEYIFTKIVSLFKWFNKEVSKSQKSILKKKNNKLQIDEEDLPWWFPSIFGSFVEKKPKTFLEQLEDYIGPFKIFAKGLVTFINGSLALLSGLSAGIGKILKVVGDILFSIGTVLTKIFTKQKLQDTNERLWAIILILGITTAITAILGNTLKNLVWGLTALFNPLGNLSDALTTLADSKLINSYANLINSITRALILVAGAIAILASINKEGLWKPLVVLGVTLAIMAALVVVLLKYTNKAYRGTRTWLDYTSKFRDIFVEGVQKLFKAGEVAIKKQSELAKIYAISTFITLLTNALLKISVAMLIIDKVSWDTVLKTLAIVTLLVSSIILVSVLCKKGAIDVKKATPGLLTMIGIAAVIRRLGKTLVETQDIDWSKAWPILVAITITLSMLLAMILTLAQSKGKQNISSAILIVGSLLSICAVLAAFTRTMKVLTSVDDMGKLAVAITSVFAFMVTFMLLLSILASLKKQQVEKAKAGFKLIATFAGSLLIFAMSMKALSTIEWNQFAVAVASIGSLVGSVIILVTALSLLSKIYGEKGFSKMLLESAISFAVLTTALIPFTIAMKALSLIGWEGIAKGFIALAGSIIILGAGAILLKNLIPIIISFAASVITIGVGILAAGLGLQALAKGLLLMANSSSEILGKFTEAFREFGPDFMQALGESFADFLTGIIKGFIDMTPTLIYAFERMIESIIDLLHLELPRIITLVITSIANLLEQLADAAESIADSVWRILLAVLKTLDDHGDEIFDKLLNIMIDSFRQLKLHAKELVNELGGLIVNLLEGLEEWLGPNIDKIVNILLDILGIILKSMTVNIVRVAALAAKLILTLTAFALALTITLLGSLSSLFVQFIGGIFTLLISIISGFGPVLAKFLFTFILTTIDLLVTVISNSGTLLVKAFKSLFISIGALLMGTLAELVKDIPLIGLLYDPLKKAQNFFEKKAHEVTDVSGATEDLQKSISDASSNILKTVTVTVDGIGNTLAGAVSIINKAAEIANSTLTKAFEEFGEAGESTGANFIAGLFDSIDKGADVVADKTGEVIDDAVEAAKDAGDIHSPSRVMMRIGEFITEGLSIGIQNGKDSVVDNMAKVLDSTIGITEDILEDQEGNDITLVVGLDTSNVEAQAAKVNDIMSSINNPSLSLYGKNADYASASMKSGEMSDSAEITTDKSTKVTYNNTFNISSTDPQESAEEIDKKLKEQSLRAKYARGGI